MTLASGGSALPTPYFLRCGWRLFTPAAVTCFMILLKLSRQDSFGTPVGVRLSFLYPSPMRGAARRKKMTRPRGKKKEAQNSLGQLFSVRLKSDTDHTGSDESKKDHEPSAERRASARGRVLREQHFAHCVVSLTHCAKAGGTRGRGARTHTLRT